MYLQVPVSVLSQLALIEDSIRVLYWPHVKYITDRTESGNAKIVIEFSSDHNDVNATIVTPVSGYEYVQVPLHQQLFEGMTVNKPVPQPGWLDVVMDNTRFSTASLYKMMKGQSGKSSLNSAQCAINTFTTYIFKHDYIYRSFENFHVILSSVFLLQRSAPSILKF